MEFPQSLKHLKRQGMVYDVETYRNLFMVTFYQLKDEKYYIFALYKGINQLSQIREFIKGKVLIGYNNFSFDDAVMNYIIREKDVTTEKIYSLAQDMISGERNPYRYCSRFTSYDLLEIIRAGFNVQSLKSTAVNLKHNKVQDLPIAFDSLIKPEQLNDMARYNCNDVEITTKLLYQLLDKLDMREGLSKEFGIDLRSAADSTIAKLTLNAWYEERSGISPRKLKSDADYPAIAMKDIIYDYVKFDNPIMRDYLKHIKSLTIYRTDKTPTSDRYNCDIEPLTFDGLTYSIGLGGIHSEDEPGILRESEDMMILDVDVASQYPTAIIHNEICPDHLDKDVFVPLVKELVDKRLEYKKKKKLDKKFDILQAGLKITVNTLR